MKKPIFLLLFLITTSIQAGEIDELISKGTTLRDGWNEAEALKYFNKAVAIDSNHVFALHNLSFLLGSVGDRKTDKNVQLQWLNKAVYIGKKAKTLDPNDAEAHFSYMLALGRLSEIAASPSERVANAKIIEESCYTVIKLDPRHAGAHHVLGRFNHELMEISWYERLAINLLFGGTPDHVSHAEAERFLKKAISLRPNYLLYYYDLARLYDDMDREEDAIRYCRKALSMPVVTPDDLQNKKDAKELLEDLE